MKRLALIWVALVIVALSATAASAGFLADWGVNPYRTSISQPDPYAKGNATLTASRYTPTSPPANLRYFAMSTVEDTVDRYTSLASPGYGYVGPGYGGQPFDAEASYFAFDDSHVYIGVITGTPPSYQVGSNTYYGAPDPWATRSYPAGDLFLGLNTAAGTYNYAVKVRQTAYPGLAVKGTALTTSSVTDFSQSNPYQVSGGVTDSLGPADGLVFDYGAFDPGQGRYTYHAKYGDTLLWDHYAIEAMIPIEFFGDLPWDMTYQLHWTQKCGNDNVRQSGTTPDRPVPEPATLILVGSGLLGLAGLRRKQHS